MGCQRHQLVALTMTRIIQSLADMTAHRNRELLDLALAEALMDVVTPQKVVFVMGITQDGETRWLERARYERGMPPVLIDPMWAHFQSLDPADAHPLRQVCLHSMAVQQQPPSGDRTTHITMFPLSGDGGLESVLEVHSTDPMSAQTLQVVHSMQRVYHNMHALLDYSERDSLTNLLNRKSFDDTFFKALGERPVDTSGDHADCGLVVQQERRHAPPVESYWLGMLDIDHFKQVNDSFGHLIGDEVLLLVARLLRHGFRFHDRLYRFGGEEFVVLMRCPDANLALSVFERFRKSMESFAFPQVGRITVSIGISRLTASDTPAMALDRADQAVYAAKSSGRNRVIDHAELVRQGQASTVIKTGDIELF